MKINLTNYYQKLSQFNQGEKIDYNGATWIKTETGAFVNIETGEILKESQNKKIPVVKGKIVNIDDLACGDVILYCDKMYLTTSNYFIDLENFTELDYLVGTKVWRVHPDCVKLSIKK